MARRNRQQQVPAGRRSVTAPLAGKPKSQSGGEPVTRKRRLHGVVSFVGEVRGELAKVDFPNRHQTWQSTSVVIAACVIVGLYLYGLDQVFARLVKQLVDLQN
jgi:preprotein translocase SecE subunit